MTLVGDGVRLAADDGIRLAAVQGNVDASCLEGSAAPKIERETNRHRFVRAATGAGMLAAVPYLYVLWGGRFDPYRVAVPGGYFSNFYDFQTRAFLRGELHIPTGVQGIEAFVMNGRDYIYYPPFPSLLRLPVFIYTNGLDGRFTAISLLLSWVSTLVLTAALLWRIRCVARRDAPVTRFELMLCGLVVFAVGAGSVLVFLGSLPWVYHEAYAWSTVGAIGALYGLVGIIEQTRRSRLVVTALFTTMAVLSRTTSGWALGATTVLTAVWFATGRCGSEHRRRWKSVAVAGVVPVVIGASINYAKFRHPYMFPLQNQVWTQLNSHRREALQRNGGSLAGRQFFLSALVNYFRPDGVRFEPIFPFVSLPSRAAGSYGGAYFDQQYRTGSVPGQMPGLFAMMLCGAVVVFRRRVAPVWSALRIPFLGAIFVTGGVMFYGYTANRYTTEFLPALIFGTCLAVVPIAKRAEAWKSLHRGVALGFFGVLVAFGSVANAAAGVTFEKLYGPNRELRTYIGHQETISEGTGDPLMSMVTLGDDVPSDGPTDNLRIVGECSAMFVETGDTYEPWIAVDARGWQLDVAASRHLPRTSDTQGQRVLASFVGDTTSTLSIESVAPGEYVFAFDDGRQHIDSSSFPIDDSHSAKLDIVPDTERLVFKIGGPDYWGITIPMMRWNADWFRIPFLLQVVLDEQPGGGLDGLKVTGLPGERPALCGRILDRYRLING